jgi:peroxiredoxin
MRLLAPCQAVDFEAYDIDGNYFRLSDVRNKVTVLSFFRDASCPFCNVRIYEYTKKYEEWAELGIEVVAVFTSSPDKVKKFVAKNPRPFQTFGDPDLDIYRKYLVEKSLTKFLLGVAINIPRFLKGLYVGGRFNPINRHINLVPADFIITPKGKIIDAWYGRDVSEHIPMQRIERVARLLRKKRAKRQL